MKGQTKELAVSALLLAADVILTRILAFNTPLMKIGLGFAATALCAMLYGPWWAAGVAALGEGAFLQRAKELIDRERPRLRAALEDMGLWVCPSDVNYLLFRGPESLLGDLRKRGVLLRDCANFPGLGVGWYRMAVRREEENDRLLAAMRACIRSE